jgi:transcriptional repressor NrdR
MRCPFLRWRGTRQVVDTRENEDGRYVVSRRRRCLECEKRFTTYERVELKISADRQAQR